MANGTNGDGWPYTPGNTPPPSDEMRDLAARMAADEANEGNYAAAAELQAAADRANAKIQRLHGPVDNAPTGPLTPGQVPCRECQLDDRTRAASDPDDLLCDVCREDTPNRVRQLMLEDLRHALENLFGMTDELRDDETTAGVAERELICERVGAAMKLAALAEGHMLPTKLVNAAEGKTTVELQKKIDELEAQIGDRDAAERIHRFVEKSLDRLKPQLVRRIAEVICPPLNVSADEVKGWPQDMVDARKKAQDTACEAAERLVEQGLRFVPPDAETELAAEHLRFIVAATKDTEFLPAWGGQLFELPSEAAGDLADARQWFKTRAPEAANWGVFGLVRVPDEVVFGKWGANRG